VCENIRQGPSKQGKEGQEGQKSEFREILRNFVELLFLPIDGNFRILKGNFRAKTRK
jgi:hypothetical protein